MPHQFYQVIEVKFNVDEHCLGRVTPRSNFSVVAGIGEKMGV